MQLITNRQRLISLFSDSVIGNATVINISCSRIFSTRITFYSISIVKQCLAQRQVKRICTVREMNLCFFNLVQLCRLQVDSQQITLQIYPKLLDIICLAITIIK